MKTTLGIPAIRHKKLATHRNASIMRVERMAHRESEGAPNGSIFAAVFTRELCGKFVGKLGSSDD